MYTSNMNKNNIFFILNSLIICLVFILLFRVENLHSKTSKLSTSVDSIVNEQNILKTMITNAKPKYNQSKKAYKIDIGNSVVLGHKNAPVTIIKWTDFQCPYCAKSAPIVAQLLKKYPNDVKVVVKNFPLSSHRQALSAAKYSLAAHKQGKYKEMYEKIFANYQSLKSNENLPVKYAKELGLNMDQFLADYSSNDIALQINTEIKQLRSSGMRLSVPKFLINGREPQGPRTVNNWSVIIENELKKIKS